jgi:hypothetical protein
MSEWPLTKSQSGLKISLFSVKFAKNISFSMQVFSMDVHWIKTIISYNIDLMVRHEPKACFNKYNK